MQSFFSFSLICLVIYTAAVVPQGISAQEHHHHGSNAQQQLEHTDERESDDLEGWLFPDNKDYKGENTCTCDFDVSSRCDVAALSGAPQHVAGCDEGFDAQVGDLLHRLRSRKGRMFVVYAGDSILRGSFSDLVARIGGVPEEDAFRTDKKYYHKPQLLCCSPPPLPPTPSRGIGADHSSTGSSSGGNSSSSRDSSSGGPGGDSVRDSSGGSSGSSSGGSSGSSSGGCVWERQAVEFKGPVEARVARHFAKGGADFCALFYYSALAPAADLERLAAALDRQEGAAAAADGGGQEEEGEEEEEEGIGQVGREGDGGGSGQDEGGRSGEASGAGAAAGSAAPAAGESESKQEPLATATAAVVRPDLIITNAGLHHLVHSPSEAHAAKYTRELVRSVLLQAVALAGRIGGDSRGSSHRDGLPGGRHGVGIAAGSDASHRRFHHHGGEALDKTLACGTRVPRVVFQDVTPLDEGRLDRARLNASVDAFSTRGVERYNALLRRALREALLCDGGGGGGGGDGSGEHGEGSSASSSSIDGNDDASNDSSSSSSISSSISIHGGSHCSGHGDHGRGGRSSAASEREAIAVAAAAARVGYVPAGELAATLGTHVDDGIHFEAPLYLYMSHYHYNLLLEREQEQEQGEEEEGCGGEQEEVAGEDGSNDGDGEVWQHRRRQEQQSHGFQPLCRRQVEDLGRGVRRR